MIETEEGIWLTPKSCHNLAIAMGVLMGLAFTVGFFVGVWLV
jgi:hypothetical protein